MIFRFETTWESGVQHVCKCGRGHVFYDGHQAFLVAKSIATYSRDKTALVEIYAVPIS